MAYLNQTSHATCMTPPHTHIWMGHEQHRPCHQTPFNSLGMDHSSFHWRASWDLEIVEAWIPRRAILLSPAKKPPSPATRLPGCHGQSCWLQCQQPLSAPRVESKQFLLPSSVMATEPSSIPPPLQSLLPGAPRSWALYQVVQTSYPTIWASLAHHHVTPSQGASSSYRDRSRIFSAVKQLFSFREILLTLDIKRIWNPLGKLKNKNLYIHKQSGTVVCIKFLIKRDFWQWIPSQKQQRILPNFAPCWEIII